MQGQLIVNTPTPGIIQQQDIESFTFTIPPMTPFAAAGLTLSPPTIPISSSGIPTNPSAVLIAGPTNAVPGMAGIDEILLPFNSQSFDPSNPQYVFSLVTTYVPGRPIITGDYGNGFWTVSGSAVPEPSSLIMIGLAVVCGIAYGVASKHRTKRINTSGA
jgi:hypothetical protein